MVNIEKLKQTKAATGYPVVWVTFATDLNNNIELMRVDGSEKEARETVDTISKDLNFKDPFTVPSMLVP